MSVYFDNAATTPLAPEVIEEMKRVMEEDFGNPSSIHTHGRKAKTIVEKSRKKIAELLQTSPAEIFFTSCGTEADNAAIYGSVETHGITHIVSSPIEHHAVLHPVEDLARTGKVELTLLEVDENGSIDMDQLFSLIKKHGESLLVSLMHGNNEIGNLTDIKAIGEACKENKSLFHSDTVQTMGHFPLKLNEMPLHYIAGSAHKFHGPKGVGIFYMNAEKPLSPLILGGAQERNMRAGTENIYGIAGAAKALELAIHNMEEDRKHIASIKQHMIDRLKEIDGIQFNGLSADAANSLYTVLNVTFPTDDMEDMMLFSLDIDHISVSGGSACASGTNQGSHVLQALQTDPNKPSIRFSFSKYNTSEEVDLVVNKMKTLLD